jgi:WD40 repeat protein
MRLCAWDTKTGEEALPPVSFPNRLAGLSLTPDGGALVVGGWTTTFSFHHPETFELQKTLTAAQGNTMHITPDGKQAVVHRNSGGDPEMLVYELGPDSLTAPQQIELWAENENPANIGNVVLSPDGLTIAVAFTNGVVKTWIRGEDLSWNPSVALPMPEGAGATQATFDSSGRLLTGDSSGEVRIWNLASESGPELQEVLPGADAITSLVTSPDGMLLLTGSQNGILQIWAISNQEKVLSRIEGLGTQDAQGMVLKGALSLALARERRLLFTTSPGESDHPNAIMAWKIGGGRLTPAFLLEGHEHPPGRLVLSPDERYLASGELPHEGENSPLLLWDLETRESRTLTDGHPFPNFVFSPDGTTLVGQTWWGPNRNREGPSPLLFWDIEKGGDPVAETQEHFQNDVFGLAFTPAGNQLLVADSDDGQPLRIFDYDPVSRETTLAHTMPGNTGRLTQVAFSPDGEFFVSASSHGAHTQLWDFAPRTPRGPTPRVELQDWAWCSTISPDGSLVAVGGGNCKVVVARTDGSGEVIGRYQGTEGWLRITTDLAFDSDNRTLFMSFTDGQVVSWRIPARGGVVEPNRYLEVVDLAEPSSELLWDFGNRHLSPPDTTRTFGEIGSLYLPVLEGDLSPRESQLALFEYYLDEELFHSAHAVLLGMAPEQGSDLWSALSLAITDFLLRAKTSGESAATGAIWHLAQGIFEEHPPNLEVEIMLLFRNFDWERLVALLRERLPGLPARERSSHLETVFDLLDQSIDSLLTRTELLAEDDPALPSRELLLVSALYRTAITYREAWETDPWAADRAFQEMSPAVQLLERLGESARDILVSSGSKWKFHDQPGAPDPIWNQVGYDDQTWQMGDSPLGYGGLRTLSHGTTIRQSLWTKRTVAAGQPPQLTYYFRKEFETPAGWKASLQRLSASLLCDDGLVLYLDGEEILRINLPEGPITPETTALETVSADAKEIRLDRLLPPLSLKPGPHLLAAEIHQAENNSSDIIWDLALFVPSENTWRSVANLSTVVGFLATTDPEHEVLPWLAAFTGDEARNPGDAAFNAALRARILSSLGADEEALRLADQQIAALQDSHNPPRVGERKLWQRWKADVLQQLGRPADEVRAAKEEFEAIPARDPKLDPRHIDLTDHYNQSLYDGDLSAIPETYVPRKGISYDLRGLIELNSGTLDDGQSVSEKRPYEVPDKVEGIQVGQRAKALHFLVNVSWGLETEAVEVARFILHYEDGTTAERPLVFLEDVVDWVEANNRPSLPKEKIGWRNPRPSTRYRLSELTWENPHPDKTITSINFVSALKKAGPVVVAITLE